MKDKPHIEITKEDAACTVSGQVYLRNKRKLLDLGFPENEAHSIAENYAMDIVITACKRGDMDHE